MQNQNSGGWRYGNGSNDFLYKNEGIDNELLKRAAELSGAPKGLLDQAVQVNPLDKLMQQDKGYGGSGNGQSGSSGTVSGETGIGVGSMSNARDKAAGMAGLGTFAKSPGLLGGIMGVMAANNVIGQTNQSVLGHVNNMADPIAALNAIQGWTDVDQGYLSDGFGSSVAAGGGWSSLGADTQASIAASSDPIGSFADAIGSGDGGSYGGYGDAGNGSYGGDTGGYGGSYGSGSVGGFGGSDSSNDGAGGYGGSDNGYYKGGKVTRDRLSGPNPKGPDDGYAALQDGEYVIKASSVKKYGKGLLADINSGKYKA